MKVLIEAANAAVGVEDGIIVMPQGPFDHVIRIPDGMIRSGLVNAHEHLHRNHYGRLGDPPYANAYDWAADIHARQGAVIARGRNLPRRQALLRGAWKNLLAGVTHVMHHDAWEADFESGFPLTVARVSHADSVKQTADLPRPGKPFAIHLAEGTDESAAEEVRTIEAMGRLNRGLIAVHAVGADDDGVARLRACGCSIVWCPSSNGFLFDRTAPAALLAEDMDVLLGSDSLISGDGDLLDELRLARSLGFVSDARLLAAVGPLAARRLGFPAPSLALGQPANLIVIRRPLLNASAEDMALVMAGGEMRVLDRELIPSGYSHGRLIKSHGVQRWISEKTVF